MPAPFGHLTQEKHSYKVQRRAARFVKNDHRFTSSVTAMLQDLEWPTCDGQLKQLCCLKFYIN